MCWLEQTVNSADSSGWHFSGGSGVILGTQPYAARSPARVWLSLLVGVLDRVLMCGEFGGRGLTAPVTGHMGEANPLAILLGA